MNWVDQVKLAIQQADIQDIRSACLDLFEPMRGPTFGAAKAADYELAALKALVRLEVVPSDPSEYDLVMTLRVTRAKARSLLYRLRLAELKTLDELDDRVREVVASPTVERATGGARGRVHWIVDVPDPLVADRIRQRVLECGFVADGSFSPSLIKLSPRAYAALVEGLIPESERARVWKLVQSQAALADKRDLREVIDTLLESVAKGAGGQLGGKVGESVAKELFDLMKHGACALLQRLSQGVDNDG